MAKPQIVDTHCHLYARAFAGDIDAVIRRAEEEGVTRFYLPAIDREVLDDMLALEKRYPEKCVAMMGVHPCSIKEDYEAELALAEEWLEKRSFAAVGEIGLDYYWDKTFVTGQQKAFRLQIDWALAYRLPIVIHSRESMDDCIGIVEEKQNGSLRGVFHCFTGSYEQALRIIDLGFYLGIGGVLTYKNSGLPAALEHIPLGHLVLETDAPYLAPVPFRGKRNESSYLKYIAEKLAEVKGTDLATIARVTTENAEKLFGT